MKKIFCASLLFLFSFVSLFAETAGKWSVGYGIENILDFKDRKDSINGGNISASYWFNEKLGLNFDLAFGNDKYYTEYNGDLERFNEIKESIFKISVGLNNVIAEAGKFRLYSNENIYYKSQEDKVNGNKIDFASETEFGIAVGLNAEYFVRENFSLALRTDVLSFTSFKNDGVGETETSFNLVDTISPTLEAKYYF